LGPGIVWKGGVKKGGGEGQRVVWVRVTQPNDNSEGGSRTRGELTEQVVGKKRLGGKKGGGE